MKCGIKQGGDAPHAVVEHERLPRDGYATIIMMMTTARMAR